MRSISFLFCDSSLLKRCHRESKLSPNICAATFTEAASLPFSLTLIPNNSRSPARDFRADGKHSFFLFLACGSPSMMKGIMYSSRPESINSCTSLHTHSLFAAYGEHITIRNFEESKPAFIALSRTPPLKSVVSLKT